MYAMMVFENVIWCHFIVNNNSSGAIHISDSRKYPLWVLLSELQSALT